jgi:hypothetical protein
MLFVAVAPRFRNGEQALVDAARRPVVRLSYPRPVRHALPSGVGDLSRGCRLRSHWLLLERRHPEREGGFYEAGVPRDQRVLKRQGFAGPISNLLRNAGNVGKNPLVPVGSGPRVRKRHVFQRPIVNASYGVAAKEQGICRGGTGNFSTRTGNSVWPNREFATRNREKVFDNGFGHLGA